MTEKDNKNKKEATHRYRHLQVAPHVFKENMYKFDCTGKRSAYSDKQIERIAKNYKPNSKYASYSDSYYTIWSYFQQLYYGTKPLPDGHKPCTWFSSKYIFDDKAMKKRSNQQQAMLVGNHMLLRYLVFGMEHDLKRSKKTPRVPVIAYICHDKDRCFDLIKGIQLVAPHCQMSINDPKRRTIKQVANWIGLRQQDVQVGSQAKNATENSLAYLSHIKQPYDTDSKGETDGHTGLKKHWYNDIHLIHADFDYPQYYHMKRAYWLNRRKLLIYRHNSNQLPKLNQELAEGVIDMATIRKTPRLFAIYLTQYHNQTDAVDTAIKANNDWNRTYDYKQQSKSGKLHRFNVLIYGDGGNGKSYIAQRATTRLCHDRKQWNSIKLTGGGKGLFKDYNGQSVVQLDDLHPGTIKFQTWLNLYDQEQLRVLNAVKEWTPRVTITTISHTPWWFADHLKLSQNEDKSQAIRRPDLIIHAVVAKDHNGNVEYVKDKAGRRWPKRRACVYFVRHKSTPYTYHTGYHRSFKSNYVLYPNPQTDNAIGKYAYVKPSEAIKLIVKLAKKANDPHVDHTRDSDRQEITESDYTQPSHIEQKRINHGLAVGSSDAIRVANRVNQYNIGIGHDAVFDVPDNEDTDDRKQTKDDDYTDTDTTKAVYYQRQEIRDRTRPHESEHVIHADDLPF